MLNSGDIPNIYSPEEQDQIMTAMKPIVRDLGQQPTKANLMAAYVARVRSNIHMVLCMRYTSGLYLHAFNANYSLLILCLSSLCNGIFISKPQPLGKEEE